MFNEEMSVSPYNLITLLADIHNLKETPVINYESRTFIVLESFMNQAFSSKSFNFYSTFLFQLVLGCRISELLNSKLHISQRLITIEIFCSKQKLSRTVSFNPVIFTRDLYRWLPNSYNHFFNEKEFNRRFYKYVWSATNFMNCNMNSKSHLLRHLNVCILYDILKLDKSYIKKYFKWESIDTVDTYLKLLYI